METTAGRWILTHKVCELSTIEMSLVNFDVPGVAVCGGGMHWAPQKQFSGSMINIVTKARAGLAIVQLLLFCSDRGLSLFIEYMIHTQDGAETTAAA